MDPNDLQEVRKFIEGHTSKVSLRDLEKKGFRKVKVLRSNDIDELIRRAVHTVIAQEGARVTTAAEQEELVRRSREELREIMQQAQAAEQERAELAAARETLEEQVRVLQERLRGRGDLEGKMKELQRRLADEEDARRAAEQRAGSVDVGAISRAEAAERRVAELERRLGDADRRVQEAARTAEGWKEEAERGRDAARRGGDLEITLAALRDENHKLRDRAGRVETESRLKDEIEIPKLRERIEDLQGELRGAKSEMQRLQAQGALAGVGLDESRIRLLFKEMATELRAGGGGGGPADPGLVDQMGRMSKMLSEGLARMTERQSGATGADLDAMKVSLEKLFAHEAAGAIESNVDSVEVKEKTTADGVKDHLKKLKSLRKGRSSE